jgi:hypothetical protein
MRMRFLLLLIPLLATGQEPATIFGTTVVIPSGFRGDIYYLPRNTETLADLTRLHPQSTFYTTSLNAPPQSFLLGFPGITRRFEWFAIDYSGKFWIETPGLYRFRLTSDDGAMLYIDGQLIADNDGTHSTTVRLGSIRLRGTHDSRAVLPGTRRYRSLILEVAGPGEQPRIFSAEEFKPRPTPNNGVFQSRQGWGLIHESPNRLLDRDRTCKLWTGLSRRRCHYCAIPGSGLLPSLRCSLCLLPGSLIRIPTLKTLR